MGWCGMAEGKKAPAPSAGAVEALREAWREWCRMCCVVPTRESVDHELARLRRHGYTITADLVAAVRAFAEAPAHVAPVAEQTAEHHYGYEWDEGDKLCTRCGGILAGDGHTWADCMQAKQNEIARLHQTLRRNAESPAEEGYSHADYTEAVAPVTEADVRRLVAEAEGRALLRLADALAGDADFNRGWGDPCDLSRHLVQLLRAAATNGGK